MTISTSTAPVASQRRGTLRKKCGFGAPALALLKSGLALLNRLCLGAPSFFPPPSCRTSTAPLPLSSTPGTAPQTGQASFSSAS
ncbi:hypothetical protein AUC68_04485 [Methyloceanibacter methanicus]|uniref:Uncharacterized protein n=1 Tax=Methyloceanibacter methanicus TaxID=1774968 RepID=A0A1E3W0D0_9HYPH|nr:hypothetical protein AUC68_04485 [Methyloceanibacter methanicus]